MLAAHLDMESDVCMVCHVLHVSGNAVTGTLVAWLQSIPAVAAAEQGGQTPTERSASPEVGRKIRHQM